MATAPLSPPRPRLRSLPRARPLSPRAGSLPVAAHAYHGTPTGARQTRVPAGTLARSEFVGAAHIVSTARSCTRAAVLRDISAGTSYQTARLVFRRYAHVLPASCTSARLGPSARVSAGVGRHRHSSPSFGPHRGDCPREHGARAPCVRLAAAEGSLGRVSIRDRGLGASCTFAFHPPRGFSDFPRGTSSLSDPPCI